MSNKMALKKSCLLAISAAIFITGCAHIKENWRFNQYPARRSSLISEENLKTPFKIIKVGGVGKWQINGERDGL